MDNIVCTQNEYFSAFLGGLEVKDVVMRATAVTPVRPMAWELLPALGAAKKKKKKMSLPPLVPIHFSSLHKREHKLGHYSYSSVTSSTQKKKATELHP